MGCGQFSFGFDGLELTSDGTGATHGPIQVDLETGTYDVIFQTSVESGADAGQQWFITLDSGYTSPTTSEIVADTNFSVDVFESQSINSSAVMFVHHAGEADAGVVAPVCVGFTPSPEMQPTGELLLAEVPESSSATESVEVLSVTETRTGVAIEETPVLALTGRSTVPLMGFAVVALVTGVMMFLHGRQLSNQTVDVE